MKTFFISITASTAVIAALVFAPGANASRASAASQQTACFKLAFTLGAVELVELQAEVARYDVNREVTSNFYDILAFDDTYANLARLVKAYSAQSLGLKRLAVAETANGAAVTGLKKAVTAAGFTLTPLQLKLLTEFANIERLQGRAQAAAAAAIDRLVVAIRYYAKNYRRYPVTAATRLRSAERVSASAVEVEFALDLDEQEIEPLALDVVDIFCSPTG
ncbi:MAG: hypothetical protein WCK06_09940 [Actinomycetota bacterium]